MTRAEHVEWAKRRALEYLDAGEPVNQALTSLTSDLTKHDETKSLVAAFGPTAVAIAMKGSRDEARRFIEGFQ